MMLRGWANLPHALRTGQGALDDALGMETYAYLQQNPAEAATRDVGAPVGHPDRTHVQPTPADDPTVIQ